MELSSSSRMTLTLDGKVLIFVPFVVFEVFDNLARVVAAFVVQFEASSEFWEDVF